MASFAFNKSRSWYNLEKAFALGALNLVRERGYKVEFIEAQQDKFMFHFDCGCGRRQMICCNIELLPDFDSATDQVRTIAGQICAELRRHEAGEE